MIKKLKLLFKLRSWLKSATLQGGGVVGVLAAIQTFIQSEDGLSVIDWIAAALSVTSTTATGMILGVISLAMLILRAKTERALEDK